MLGFYDEIRGSGQCHFLVLAIRLHARDNHREMSGIFFEDPGVRFDRRFRFFEIMMRGFASSVLGWLAGAACGSKRIHFRRNEMEFPAASQNACNVLERALRGSDAADGASIDALRLFNNWINIEDQHELSFIRETLAPFARRSPTKGRSAFASAGRSGESSQENILEEAGRTFWKRQRPKESGDRIAQWLAAITISA